MILQTGCEGLCVSLVSGSTHVATIDHFPPRENQFDGGHASSVQMLGFALLGLSLWVVSGRDGADSLFDVRSELGLTMCRITPFIRRISPFTQWNGGPRGSRLATIKSSDIPWLSICRILARASGGSICLKGLRLRSLDGLLTSRRSKSNSCLISMMSFSRGVTDKVPVDSRTWRKAGSTASWGT